MARRARPPHLGARPRPPTDLPAHPHSGRGPRPRRVSLEHRSLTVRPAQIVPATPSASDAGLVRLRRGGDPWGARDLFPRYARRLRALVASRLRGPVASRLSPDDIVQSVFRTLFQGVAERAYSAPEGRELWGLLCVLAI